MRPTILAVTVIAAAAVAADAAVGQVKTAQTITYPAVTAGQSAGLQISSVPVLAIDESAGCVFNRVLALVIQGNGSLVVANAGNNELCFFTRDGRLMKRVGRAGAGPAEYRNIAGLQPLPGDSLLVYDGLLRRLSILGADGGFARSAQLLRPDSALGSVTRVATLRDGTVLMGFSEFKAGAPRPEAVFFTQQLIRYDTNGSLQDRLGRFPESEHFIQAVPLQMGGVAYPDRAFGKRFTLAAAPEGFFAGDGGEATVKQYSVSGAVIAVHELKQAIRPVTAADIAEYRRRALQGASPDLRELTERLVNDMPYPSTYPAYSRLLSDPTGRIWLEQSLAPAAAGGQWIVLEPASRRASLLMTPPRFRPLAVGSSLMCGVARDDVDIESIRCFAIGER